MKHNFRQIGAALLAIILLVGAGYTIFKLSGGDLYRDAEREHDAQFGEYVDITFIGHDERSGDALLIAAVRNKPMPDELYFDTYDPFMADWIIGLMEDEPGAVLLLYQPESAR